MLDKTIQNNLKPGIYIVSTPIGNLEDITIRALKTLKASDIIVCEDTRVSIKLLAKHGIIDKSLIVYNDSSDHRDREKILKLIESGKVLSLISDAGTPIVSDPGYKLISFLLDSGVFVDIAPGASAPIAALSLSKLPPDNFYFGGFLPRTSHQRRSVFNSLMNLKATLIFFESPRRILDTIKDVREALGNRVICVAKEITKLHQEINTNKVESLIKEFEDRQIDGSNVRGEFVLLISGESENDGEGDSLKEKLHSEILALFEENFSAKDITEMIYDNFKSQINKKEIYNMVNQIKKSLK